MVDKLHSRRASEVIADVVTRPAPVSLPGPPSLIHRPFSAVLSSRFCFELLVLDSPFRAAPLAAVGWVTSRHQGHLFGRQQPLQQRTTAWFEEFRRKLAQPALL